MARLIRKHPAAAKTLSYSIMHMSVAITVAYLISDSWIIALSIGLIEPLVQTVAYHMHERGWAKFLG